MEPLRENVVNDSGLPTEMESSGLSGVRMPPRDVDAGGPPPDLFPSTFTGATPPPHLMPLSSAVATTDALVRPRAPSSATFISTVLGTPIDHERTHEIPQQIHRFWSGGAMSPAAMTNLEQSAEKTRGTPWQHTLWYSKTLEDQMDKRGLVSPDARALRHVQRQRLQELGYQVRPIESLTVAEPGKLSRLWGRLPFTEVPPERAFGQISDKDMEIMSTKAADQVAGGGGFRFEGVKHLSDLARLMYLDRVGGHHFDVDMGLGHMDFSRPYYHNDRDGNIPLFGSLTAESEAPIVRDLALLTRPDRNLSDGPTALAGTRMAQRAADLSGMLNGMIATRPHNPRFADAIETLRGDAVNPAGTLTSGMTVNPRLLFGPDAGVALAQGAKAIARAKTVPVYLFDLEHVTPESDSR